MLKKLFISLLIISFSSIYAGVIFTGSGFIVRSQNGNVVITWQTSSETNLKHFVIERKNVRGSWIELVTIDPRQDKTYEYVDQTAFKTSDAVYIYRLKIVDNDGTVSYSDERAVAHNVSSVKRTWGSIKALFR